MYHTYLIQRMCNPLLNCDSDDVVWNERRAELGSTLPPAALNRDAILISSIRGAGGFDRGSRLRRRSPRSCRGR